MNPFYFFGDTPAEHRLPRPNEISVIRSALASHSKMLVDGERRVGKTTLLKHALEGSSLVYVDLSAAKTPEAFLHALARGIDALHAQDSSWDALLRHVKDSTNFSVQLGPFGTFGYDSPRTSLNSPDATASVITLLDGIEALARQRKRTPGVAVVFDEIQDVLSWDSGKSGKDQPRSDAARDLLKRVRGAAQAHHHVAYFFTGSIRRQLLRVVEDADAGFHKQLEKLLAPPISRSEIEPWIASQFEAIRSPIKPEVLEEIWSLTRGITGDVIKLCHYLWEQRDIRRAIDREILTRALKYVLARERSFHLGHLRLLNANQQSVLRALAVAGNESPLGTQIRRLSGVSSSGTLSRAIEALQTHLLVHHEPISGRLVFSDPFFQLALRSGAV